jgi:predicted nucleotidyltransferase
LGGYGRLWALSAQSSAAYFAPGSSLFDVLRLTDDLEQLLGRRVDIVSSGALKDRDDGIRREAIPL